jgi:hypothetical protein
MRRDALELLLALAPLTAWVLSLGLLMWSGRWKSWYRPHDFAHQFVFALFGTSPLPLILAGVAGLLLMVTILVLPIGIYVAYVPLALGVLCVLAALYILMVRPRWADPPWVAERKRELRHRQRHPSSEI